jgi:pSer/pThr/pTyr-binding forkhead associated (FHA) protein
MARLLFQDPEQAECSLRLLRRRDAYVIGCDDSCDVVLHGAGLAPKHAVITHFRDGWTLLGQRRGPTWVNGDPVAGDLILSDGDEIHVGSAAGNAVVFRDASAWVRAVAPWAASTSPSNVEPLGDSVVTIGPDDGSARGLPATAFSFDMTHSGLRAAWHDDVIVLIAERPPGCERVAIEGYHDAGASLADLEELVRNRIGDAREAALAPVDLTTWLNADTFRWLAVAGEPRHAVRVSWQRGQHTSVVLVPALNVPGALLISLTAPDVDPARNLRLRPFLQSFSFDDSPTSVRSRARLIVGDEEFNLAEHGGPYSIGSSERNDVVIEDDNLAARHACVRAVSERWQLVAETSTRKRTAVNGLPLGELRQLLWDGDEIQLFGEEQHVFSHSDHVILQYRDEVFTSARAKPAPIGPLPSPPANRRASGEPRRTRVLPRPAEDRVELMLPSVHVGCPDLAFSVVVGGLELRKQELSCELVGGQGSFHVSGCVYQGDEVLCLNDELAERFELKPRSLLRRGFDKTHLNPHMYGEPCRLFVGTNSHAVMTRIGAEDVCVAIVLSPSHQAVLVSLHGALVIEHGVCRSQDADIKVALACWRWE